MMMAASLGKFSPLQRTKPSGQPAVERCMTNAFIYFLNEKNQGKMRILKGNGCFFSNEI